MVATIHFKPDPDKMTFDEVIAIQEGNLRKAKAILVKFVTNADGQPLDEDEANELIGNIPISQLPDVLKEFDAGLTAEMKGTLPNGRGRK
jgi:hypothetical protein